MANPEHVAILKHGVDAWNKWRSTNDNVIPDLSEVDLEGATLSNADLSDAQLVHARLRGATLHSVNLSRAELDGADFDDANLCFARIVRTSFGSSKFVGADLSYGTVFRGMVSGADFRRTTLYGTVFRDCVLDGVSFHRARLSGTTFADVDLRKAKGLEQIKADGPFTIGVDTLRRSEGGIPSKFLLNAGVSDAVMRYAASLVTNPFEFYSCFISHSSRDHRFAQRLHADLQSKGVRCWFAPEDLKIGDKFRVAIDETIRVYDRLLLVLSEHSVQSDWVEKEVETAMEKECEQKRTMLFPIRLDDAVMEIKTGWPADIRRTRHIADFTHWKNHDAYQKAFERLLRDLKPSGA